MSIGIIKKQIVVAASAERAFSVFTDGIDGWWPREHHIGASPLLRIAIEPRVGGRWYSVCEDGSECDIGRVLERDRPRRIVLSWQISADWQFDPELITEVRLEFIALAPKQTRVELEHHHLDRLGPKAPELWKTFDSQEGWSTTLALFAKVAESVES